MRHGLFAAVGAYFIWGLFPLYWKLLHQVPAVQVMAHRLAWCAVFVALWLSLREGWPWVRQLSPKLLGMLGASALLVAVNWWLYIWAVNAGHVVETSLGYFINPLVSVLLGVVVLSERLRPRQWLAVGIAALGVLWLSVQGERPPWIALALALTFGGYGLIRKLAVVPAAQGLMVESAILLLPALGVLIAAQILGQGAFGTFDRGTDALLVLAGPVTALPLVLFAYGARRIPLSTIGFLQYLAPTLQLACGVFVFHEPFTGVQAIGFGCIWLALAIYALDGLWRTHRLRTHRP